jgi:hypothetical protein
VRNPTHVRRGHPARPAPFRPEVDEHGNLRVTNDLFEVVRSNLEWLRARVEPAFAPATSTLVGEMARWDSILLTAIGAKANHGTARGEVADPSYLQASRQNAAGVFMRAAMRATRKTCADWHARAKRTACVYMLERLR